MVVLHSVFILPQLPRNASGISMATAVSLFTKASKLLSSRVAMSVSASKQGIVVVVVKDVVVCVVFV